jgi:hypothetical protein
VVCPQWLRARLFAWAGIAVDPRVLTGGKVIGVLNARLDRAEYLSLNKKGIQNYQAYDLSVNT